MSKPIIAYKDRFFANVRKTDTCWIWEGSMVGKPSMRYGYFSYGGQNIRAHRFSWELHNNQKIPPGLFCCHKCDNPPCVNPDHLFLGTARDNYMDCVHKGRLPWRQMPRPPKTKLCIEQVREIKKLLIEGFSPKELAARYGVDPGCIRHIIRGNTWVYVEANAPQRSGRGE